MNGKSLLIKGGTLVTMNQTREIIREDLLIKNGEIKEIGRIKEKADLTLNVSDRIVLPGFVQTHIHLCQTLFRGLADDYSLIDWLEKRIWPLEAAHNDDSAYLSSLLGAAELIRGGTTCILGMETINHTDAIFSGVRKSGLRACLGKAMMDGGDENQVLKEDTQESLDESLRLLKKWHQSEGGRIRYAFAPRFLLSCSEELLKEVGKLARECGVLVHIHAAENWESTEMVKRKYGTTDVLYLDQLGLTGENLCLAHCVFLQEEEMEILREKRVKVLHCPTSNLKLGSGVAKVSEMLKKGIKVSLGADGAPCNNNLDIFQEMKIATLLQRKRDKMNSPSPLQILEMATIGGAEALGLANSIGSIEKGKKADLVILNLNKFHTAPCEDLYSTLVYAARSSDVETSIIDGEIVMENRIVKTVDEERIVGESKTELRKLLKRAKI